MGLYEGLIYVDSLIHSIKDLIVRISVADGIIMKMFSSMYKGQSFGVEKSALILEAAI